MANVKISALNSATIPLSGTETIPIVQGGETKKVNVSNLLKNSIQIINSAYISDTSTTVTNTFLETVSMSLKIPANTYGVGLLETFFRAIKIGTLGTMNLKMYKNSVNSLVGASYIAYFGANLSPTTKFFQGIRTSLILGDGTITSYSTTNAGPNDITTTINAGNIATFDVAVDNYILFTIQLQSITDIGAVVIGRLTKSI